MRTSPGPACRSASSTTSSASGPPNVMTPTAFTAILPGPGPRRHRRRNRQLRSGKGPRWRGRPPAHSPGVVMATNGGAHGGQAEPHQSQAFPARRRLKPTNPRIQWSLVVWKPRAVIIDAQVHAYERNHPGRPWAATLHGPEEVTGDDMVAAMDAVGVDGALLVSPWTLYRYDPSYAVEGPRAAPRPLRADHAGRRPPRRRRRGDRGVGGHPRGGRHPADAVGWRPEGRRRPRPRPGPGRGRPAPTCRSA